MEKLVKTIQKKWLSAKQKAVKLCESQGKLTLAKKIAECEMFRGNESLEELINLMFSPQGIEFLTTFNFPDVATFRKFKKYHPEQYGVYIDKGEISLVEPRRAFLIGDTIAEILFEETAGNRVNLMCGARATITARGYSLIRIEKDAFSEVKVNAEEHSKVML